MNMFDSKAPEVSSNARPDHELQVASDMKFINFNSNSMHWRSRTKNQMVEGTTQPGGLSPL